ncbi:class I SAM-dependent methyltransferase [Novipirellula artificiosorum]|uniref:Demethylmenaquinone methyltransferase n=1 Tax=Novipirellula artificiosorum TaxID=2528016 RepID=A0A5C6D537_9BACT|nr:class I SAM-dependent methyltransferase [Novipirellula artificiosorum]TWU32263.1 Demethylmenaquinone methyltransferase [Novipirellula artificiosorum]
MSDPIPSSSPPKSLRSDLQVLRHLLFHPIRGETHAERLESFYGGQAENYDSFRARMLHGRRELIRSIDFPSNGIWVDLGAGTGENVVLAGEAAHSLSEIHLVDLSSSLLEIASQRIKQAGLEGVRIHLADATQFDLPPDSVDVVTFSYSLTMIPDWFEAIAVAESLLRPGGIIAVTDFYVSRKYAQEGSRQHGWLRRAFWTHWFAADNVFLSGDHIPLLHRRFEVEQFKEQLGKVPYLPLLRAPHYRFVGRKPPRPDL